MGEGGPTPGAFGHGLRLGRAGRLALPVHFDILDDHLGVGSSATERGFFCIYLKILLQIRLLLEDLHCSWASDPEPAGHPCFSPHRVGFSL